MNNQHCGKDAAMFEQFLMLVPVGVAVGLSARAVCRSSADGEGFRRDVPRWVWPAVSVMVLGVIVLGPRGLASSVAAVACLVGLPLAVAEVCRRVRGLIDQSSALAELSFNRDPTGSEPSRLDTFEPCADDSDDGSDPELVALADESVTQWLQRSRPAPSEERIDGMTRVEFAPGEKQIAVHVAFCPPLPAVPVVTCELLDDADVRLRVTTVQTYGVRIEAKRSGDIGEALAVAVRFSAWVEAASTPRQSSRSAA
ncbi:MAG: hypothetical protein HZA46_13070 [Planctomycetales bacterium]|nr:hypothetical protein [Planctomycetales bacterium]